MHIRLCTTTETAFYAQLVRISFKSDRRSAWRVDPSRYVRVDHQLMCLLQLTNPVKLLRILLHEIPDVAVAVVPCCSTRNAA